MSLGVTKVPVFVFPNTLKFYLGSRASHKQLLTLYNPYDFAMRFKVLCTAPNKYVVIDPEGSIGPHTLVDIVVRHAVPTASNCNITDKFRVSMQDHTTKQVLGKREIDAILLQGEKDDISSEGDFHNVPFHEGTASAEEQKIFLTNRPLPAHSNNNYALSIIIGLVCVGLLLLPTQEEVPQRSNLPDYLHISINFKLVLAYVLGLVSMVIFKA